MTRGRLRQDETGSASAELVVAAPLLCAILGLFLLGGLLWLDHQVLDDAARSAAEAAASQPTSALAGDIARSVARDEVAASKLRCSHLETSVDTSQFEPGGKVSVTVSCQALVPNLAFLPISKTIPLTSTQSDPLEPYRLLGK